MLILKIDLLLFRISNYIVAPTGSDHPCVWHNMFPYKYASASTHICIYFPLPWSVLRYILVGIKNERKMPFSHGSKKSGAAGGSVSVKLATKFL